MKKKTIAKVDELSDGEMKKINIGEESILLVRIDDEFYAIGGECTHYGAPLEQGMLHDGKIRCPWHQACFEATSGDLEEPPALDALSKYEVNVEGEDIVLHFPEEIKTQRVSEMANYDQERDNRIFIILGAGSAGNAAAEKLRQLGYEGRVIMITREDSLPYDRTMLSKIYLGEGMNETPLLRSEEFYQKHDIEIFTDREATNIDTSRNEVGFEDENPQSYDKLLIATGGEPRTLNIPGSDLENVYTLRSIDDADQINKTVEESTKVTIVGASFIGMETASSLTQRGLDVTIIAPESIPFENTLGEEIGQMYKDMHEENGVTFELETTVEKFEGGDKVQSVILDDGTELETDFVIMGVGVEPATDFIEDFDKNSDGSLSVDETLELGIDVYAAGDIVTFPDWRTGEDIRIEHWRLAQQHGRLAADNMVGKDVVYSSVPFFWTRHYETSLQYVGHVTDWDEIIYEGDPAERDFVAYYVKDDQILAAAGFNNAHKMLVIAELMQEGEMPSRGELETESFNLSDRLENI